MIGSYSGTIAWTTFPWVSIDFFNEKAYDCVRVMINVELLRLDLTLPGDIAIFTEKMKAPDAKTGTKRHCLML